MNAKIYNGNVQPNPKEFKIWVNDEGTIKTWNGTKWVESAAGGDGSGSGTEDNVIYYKTQSPLLLDSSADSFLKEYNFFSGVRGYYDKQLGYYYGTASSIRSLVGAKFSSYAYIDALEFRPIQYIKSWGDMSTVIYNDIESLQEVFPDLFGGNFTRMTAEEYWADYDAEQL